MPHGVSIGRGRSGSSSVGERPVSNGLDAGMAAYRATGGVERPAAGRGGRQIAGRAEILGAAGGVADAHRARISAVSQETLVLKLSAVEGEALRARLAAGPFEFRSVPHAAFQVRGEGATATLYSSGKLVVQGPDPAGFVAVWVGEAARNVARPRDEPAPVPTETSVGSDESGKGDYFGPLVVAAVRATADEARGLAEGEVKDSKRASDAAALRLGGALRRHLPHAVVRLDPVDYNARHAAMGNLNPLLAELHAQAIRELAEPGLLVVVDQFGPAALMEQSLEGSEVKLVQRTRAEVLPVVAAASLIAREEFLLALGELSEAHGVELAKGAGQPVDRAARELVRLHGVDVLGRVAKLHFKNTARAVGELPSDALDGRGAPR